MTDGHTHRMLKVKDGGLVVRALRYPLLHRPLSESVDKSPYPYGPCLHEGDCGCADACWTLSLLGILHRWTGLTLFVEDKDE